MTAATINPLESIRARLAAARVARDQISAASTRVLDHAPAQQEAKAVEATAVAERRTLGQRLADLVSRGDDATAVREEAAAHADRIAATRRAAEAEADVAAIAIEELHRRYTDAQQVVVLIEREEAAAKHDAIKSEFDRRAVALHALLDQAADALADLHVLADLAAPLAQDGRAFLMMASHLRPSHIEGFDRVVFVDHPRLDAARARITAALSASGVIE